MEAPTTQLPTPTPVPDGDDRSDDEDEQGDETDGEDEGDEGEAVTDPERTAWAPEAEDQGEDDTSGK